MDAAAVAEAISRLRGSGRLVVGIDGFGGAGKSTLAAAIVARLPEAATLPMDDFIVKDRVDDDTWEQVWDRNRLIAEVLDPIELGDVGILIVEGITSLHPDLIGRYDHRVWVSTPLEVASARGRARDAGNENERRWDRWALNDERYLEAHRPDLAADTIVANG